MAKTIFYIPKMDCRTEEKLIRDRLHTVGGKVRNMRPAAVYPTILGF